MGARRIRLVLARSMSGYQDAVRWVRTTGGFATRIRSTCSGDLAERSREVSRPRCGDTSIDRPTEAKGRHQAASGRVCWRAFDDATIPVSQKWGAEDRQEWAYLPSMRHREKGPKSSRSRTCLARVSLSQAKNACDAAGVWYMTWQPYL
jgi:hypothetical protein